MADLKKIGMILVLIDGILAIVSGILGIFDIGLGVPIGTGIGGSLLGALIGGIIAIVVGVVFIFLYLERISLPSDLVLGVVVLVLAILFTTWIGIIAGILILIDDYV